MDRKRADQTNGDIAPSVSVGRAAEQAAAEFLVLHGFTIVRSNFRARHSEGDIFARRDDLGVLVEVRYRSERSFESALASIDAAKQKKLLRIAEDLWRSRGRYGIERIRIDVAIVTREADTFAVEYFPGAISGA